jgi:hypothetical protein
MKRLLILFVFVISFIPYVQAGVAVEWSAIIVSAWETDCQLLSVNLSLDNQSWSWIYLWLEKNWTRLSKKTGNWNITFSPWFTIKAWSNEKIDVIKEEWWIVWLYHWFSVVESNLSCWQKVEEKEVEDKRVSDKYILTWGIPVGLIPPWYDIKIPDSEIEIKDMMIQIEYKMKNLKKDILWSFNTSLSKQSFDAIYKEQSQILLSYYNRLLNRLNEIKEASINKEKVYVTQYTKKNGKIVKRHIRTKANNTKKDNISCVKNNKCN